MGISAVSGADRTAIDLRSQQVQQSVSVSVMKQMMDSQEQIAEGIIKMIEQTPASLDEYLGTVIDYLI